MSKYEFKAINLIAETFEEHGVKFHVFNMRGQEELVAGFPVDDGPVVMMKFISRDNDNDVAVRIFGLINKTPKEKRHRVMEACNALNRKMRFVKFYLDNDGDVNVEYDFLVHSSDECIGEMAFEIFMRTMHILDTEYGIFKKALHTEEELDQPSELQELLSELRNDPNLPSRIRSLLDGLEEDENAENSSEAENEIDENNTSVDECAEIMDAGSEDAQASFAAFLRMISDDMGANPNGAEGIA